MKNEHSKMHTLSNKELDDVFGGNQQVTAHAIVGGFAGTSFGQGAGTLAGIMSGAATGAKWGRWGGGIGLVAGILLGGAYGAFAAGG